MVAVEHHISIGSPSATVWATLADFARISRWASNVDHSCLMTPQTEGIGMERRIQTAGSTLLETVETWEPNVALSYRIEGLPPVVKSLTNMWRLDESASSPAVLTMVTLTTEVDAGPRPLQQLIAKIVAKRLGAVSEQMIRDLAAQLETPVVEGAA